jgi:hypothetical protein
MRMLTVELWGSGLTKMSRSKHAIMLWIMVGLQYWENRICGLLLLLKNVRFLHDLPFMIVLILGWDYLGEVLFLIQFAPLVLPRMKIFLIFFLHVLILTWFDRNFSFLSKEDKIFVLCRILLLHQGQLHLFNVKNGRPYSLLLLGTSDWLVITRFLTTSIFLQDVWKIAAGAH